MKRISESLVIFHLLTEDLKNRNEIILHYKLHLVNFKDQLDEELQQHHYDSMYDLSMIRIKAYLDEFHKFFGVQDNENYYRVKKLKESLKPITSKFKEWKHIGDYRNHYAAHHYRNGKKGNSIITLDDDFANYKVPNNMTELYLAVDIILLITKSIKTVFEKEWKAAIDEYNARMRKVNENRAQPEFPMDKYEAKAAIKEMIEKVNRNLEAEYGFRHTVKEQFDPYWDRLQ